MKKRPVLRTILIVMTVLVVAGVVLGVTWGKRYYEDRYAGTDYYAMIPLDFAMTEVPMRNMEGKEVGTGIEYTLTAYNEEGEAKSVWFDVITPDTDISRGEIPPRPGEFLRIKASKTLVNGWSLINESDVPAKALAKIKGA